jgi:hypothetical protein
MIMHIDDGIGRGCYPSEYEAPIALQPYLKYVWVKVYGNRAMAQPILYNWQQWFNYA